MKPSPLPIYLARLSRVPLLLRGDYFAALGALAIAAPRNADDYDDMPADREYPWDAREKITIHPGGIAVVPIHGLIAKGYDALTAWCYDIWRAEAIEAAIAICATREDITSVVFDFNTPGGYTTGISELGTQIADLGNLKPTVAFTSTMCASAGYWLASQCEVIVCTGSCTIGSIGTYAAYYDWSEYLAKEGIELKLFRAGSMKGLHVTGHKLTPEEESFIQASIDEINAQFLSAVREGRGVIADADLQGQWFLGSAAIAKNLADFTVLSFAELLANLSATVPQTITPAKV